MERTRGIYFIAAQAKLTFTHRHGEKDTPWVQIRHLKNDMIEDKTCTLSQNGYGGLDAWMIASTAARIELEVCKANARSFICAHCVQSADLQVCFPTSSTDLLDDLSPERRAAVGVALRIWNLKHMLDFQSAPHQGYPKGSPPCA